MAYPKTPPPSFALIAFLLIAATSSLSANSQPTDSALPSSVAVVGTATCGLLTVFDPRLQVNVTLSCDGGRTALVPSVSVGPLGTFSIAVNGTAVKYINPTLCAVYIKTSVAGCPVLRLGEVLRAPIIIVPYTSIWIQIICYIRIYVTGLFVVIRI